MLKKNSVICQQNVEQESSTGSLWDKSTAHKSFLVAPSATFEIHKNMKGNSVHLALRHPRDVFGPIWPVLEITDNFDVVL